MNNVYGKSASPEVDRSEIDVGLVCVAPSDNKWYRVQVKKHLVWLITNLRCWQAASCSY